MGSHALGVKRRCYAVTIVEVWMLFRFLASREPRPKEDVNAERVLAKTRERGKETGAQRGVCARAQPSGARYKGREHKAKPRGMEAYVFSLAERTD